MHKGDVELEACREMHLHAILVEPFLKSNE
jgi:hypothetical protein